MGKGQKETEVDGSTLRIMQLGPIHLSGRREEMIHDSSDNQKGTVHDTRGAAWSPWRLNDPALY